MPGEPDQVLDTMLAVAKSMGFKAYRQDRVVHRIVQGRLSGLPRVDLWATIAPQPNGVLVLAYGRCSKMTRTANAEFAKRVVNAFLAGLSKDVRVARRMHLMLRWVLPWVLWAVFVGGAISLAAIHPKSYFSWFWPSYLLLLLLLQATRLGDRRYFGVDSRRDWISLLACAVVIASGAAALVIYGWK